MTLLSQGYLGPISSIPSTTLLQSSYSPLIKLYSPFPRDFIVSVDVSIEVIQVYDLREKRSLHTH
jgi:hypothetical protein